MTPEPTPKITDEMIEAACLAAEEEGTHLWRDTGRAIAAAVLEVALGGGYKLTKLCGEELTPGLRCIREVYGEPHRGDHEGITSTGNKVSWSAE